MRQVRPGPEQAIPAGDDRGSVLVEQVDDLALVVNLHLVDHLPRYNLALARPCRSAAPFDARERDHDLGPNFMLEASGDDGGVVVGSTLDIVSALELDDLVETDELEDGREHSLEDHGFHGDEDTSPGAAHAPVVLGAR